MKNKKKIFKSKVCAFFLVSDYSSVALGVKTLLVKYASSLVIS